MTIIALLKALKMVKISTDMLFIQCQTKAWTELKTEVIPIENTGFK